MYTPKFSTPKCLASIMLIIRVTRAINTLPISMAPVFFTIDFASVIRTKLSLVRFKTFVLL